MFTLNSKANYLVPTILYLVESTFSTSLAPVTYSLYLFAHITFPLWGNVISAICIPGQKASNLRSSRQACLSHLRTKRNIEKFHYIRNYNTHQKNLQSYQCKIQVGPPASQPGPPQCWPSSLAHPALRPLHPQPSSHDGPLNVPPSNDRELAHSRGELPGNSIPGGLEKSPHLQNSWPKHYPNIGNKHHLKEQSEPGGKKQTVWGGNSPPAGVCFVFFLNVKKKTKTQTLPHTTCKEK